NRLDGEAKIAMYRIAQEALTNIERHALASHVRIDLRGHKKGATLRIEDNGRGLPDESANPTGGLGLRNMQERVEQLEGRLRIARPRGGAGTIIEVSVPLSHLLPPEPETPNRPKVPA
ncbi:MAG: ATP-binding protein, partial [Pseudomonadota bacterium]